MVVLLDTNILIDYWRKFPPAVAFVDGMLERGTEGMAVSIITVAEAFSGTSSLQPAMRDDINLMFQRIPVLNLDNDIAMQAGELRRDHDIAITDAFIAATALAHGLTLVTRNAKHFQNVPHLVFRDIVSGS